MTKISALSDIGTSVASNDAFVLVDVSDPTTPNKKIQQQNLFLIPDGSAGTPAVRFLNDTDVGLFRPTTNTLALATGGSERLRITSAGLVGIGTSSPSGLLHVAGQIYSSGTGYLGTNSPTLRLINSTATTGRTFGINSADSGIFQVFDASAGDATRLCVDSSGRVGIGTTNVPALLNINKGATAAGIAKGLRFGLPFAGGGDNGISIEIGREGNNSNVGSAIQLAVQNYGSDSSSYIAFRTSPATVDTSTDTSTERARIDSSGRLLVGTSSARSNFFGSASAAFQVEGNLNVGSAGQIICHVYGEPAALGGPYLVLGKHRSGSIGGTTLVANNDQLGAVSFTGADGTNFLEGARIQAFVDGTPGANDMPGRLVFSTTADGASSPTERMRITQGGLFKFQASGSSYDNAAGGINEFNGSANDTLMVFRNTSGTINGSRGGIDILYTATDPNSTTASFLQCRGTSGSANTRADIRSNGGIANYQANNVNLSDINTKKDITPAAGTWDCIKEWEIVNYRYKDQPDDADLNLGVIAQQVAESCPEVITVFQEATEDQPEKLGVKEQQMYWMAIKALQEAQVRIEALEAEVAALKAQ